MGSATAVYGAPPLPEVPGESASQRAQRLWHNRRRTGVGGSDAGAILGVSPFSSKLGAWEEKRGIRPPTDEPSERMVWGNRLQDAILTGYGEDYGAKVERGGAMRRHDRHPFVIGHVDGFATPAQGARRLVEVKTAGKLDERWGEDGSADIPAHYYAQVQHYLILTGLPVCDLAALVSGRELHRFEVPADKPFQDALLDEERLFWEDVKRGEPPDPDGSEDAGRALRALFPMAVQSEVIATPEVVGYLDRLFAAREAKEEAGQEEAKWAQLVMGFMGSRERLVAPGYGATWVNRKGSPSWKSIAEELAGEVRLMYGLAEDEANLIKFDAGYMALIERHRGESGRTFTPSRKAAVDD